MTSIPGALLSYFEQHKDLPPLLSRLTAGSEVNVTGLAGSSGAFLSLILSNQRPKQLHVFQDQEAAAQFHNDLQNLGREDVHFLPASRIRGSQDEADSGMILLRTRAIEAVEEKKNWILISYALALSEPVVSGATLKAERINLRKGDRLSQDFLYEWLLDAGFSLEDTVYAPGQFALRGSLVDVYSYASEWPVRIVFEDDAITSIKEFNADDQLSRKEVAETVILPNVAARHASVPITDVLPDDTCVWLWDKSILHEIWKENKSIALIEGLKRFPLISVDHLAGVAPIDFDCRPQPLFHKNFDLLVETWRAQHEAGRSLYFFTDQPAQARRMEEIMQALNGPPFTTVPLSIFSGFLCGDTGPACYADHLLFDRYRRFRLPVHYVREGVIALRDLSRLKPGDYVTHIDHGVGRFAGLEKVDNGGRIQECIRLVYKDGDTLLVSIHNLHKIARYTGTEGQEPTLHKLGGTAWKNTRNRTKKRIKQLAFDLLKLYARRKAQKGFAFSPDSYLQRELESSFIYEDTPDQLKATEEVKADMEKPWPMDRLVCGDVGFGKTEIAIRAAFKAACDGKQTAVLVPTTILALQHYKTFSSRLSGFPVRVDYLSRFRTPTEQKRILEDLASGKIDIIIGTHLLTSDKIQFKDLGLLIVDEEQRFGVNVKEKIKNLKSTVDTLTLTATPIPRTLQFSLMGARDMSVIRTPPPNRQPITTELHTFNEKVIKDAINYELQRGGQVFFIHNRIQDLEEVAALVQRLVPSARVAVAHGQMEGRRLEETMLSFIEGHTQVLVSTAIVESGLDVPDANTIIIHNAHHFGLSDLHQLRGRVGRSNKKAFCYLITPPPSVLTEEARKRLKAIVELSDLGSGLHIALRDLDLRGAGDLLGAEQSGFISEMGYDTYQKILQEAIRELKKEEALNFGFSEETAATTEGDAWGTECVLETDLSLLLPDDYVEDITERLSIYKDLDECSTDTELNRYANQLEDRFGPLPPEGKALIDSMKLRNSAGRLGIEKLSLKGGRMILQFIENEQFYTNSMLFAKALEWLQTEPLGRLIQKVNGVWMIIDNVKDVSTALSKIRRLENFVYSESSNPEPQGDALNEGVSLR